MNNINVKMSNLELENFIKAFDGLELNVKKEVFESVSDIINIDKVIVEKYLDNKIEFTDVFKNNRNAKKFFKLVYDNEKYKNYLDEKIEKPKDLDESLYYNYEFKHQFALRYRDNTARVVKSLFRKTAKIERELNKDLYDFTQFEIEKVLYSLKAKTIRSLQNSISTIDQYIEYANRYGKFGASRKDFSRLFNTKEKIEKYLDKEAEENMIFNKEEIMLMADNAENAQDGVILALLFDGVSHKNEFEELINLEKKDIDFDNKTINLEDRTISMSEETALLVKDALLEDVYYSVNSESGVTRRYKIAESNFVLRGLRNKIQVNAQLISQRLLRLKDKFDEKYLNATNVAYSGQLHYAKELIENGVDTDTAVDIVLNRFGLPINNSSQFYLKTRIEKYLKKFF